LLSGFTAPGRGSVDEIPLIVGQDFVASGGRQCAQAAIQFAKEFGARHRALRTMRSMERENSCQVSR
jgi:hypothetical protein